MRFSLPWFGCVWFLALPAFAQPRVDWQVSADCPSAVEARAEIERLLRAPLAELGSDVSAVVRLRPDSAATFAATIEVQQDGVTRTRVLHSADCAVLAHASAVIVALAIDPMARIDQPNAPVRPQAMANGASQTVTTSSSASGGRDATSPPLASPPPAARPAAKAFPGVRRTTRVELTARSSATPADDRTPPAADGGKDTLRPFFGAALGVDAGTLPKLAPALTLLVGLETSWSRAALRLSYAPPQRATADNPPGLAGRVGLSAAAIEAGLRSQLAWLELSSLVGIEAGVFSARGSEGVTEEETKHPLWLGGYLAGGIALFASASFKIGLRLDGIVALRRPSFVLRSDQGDDRTVHRPHLVSGRSWLELELHFPR